MASAKLDDLATLLARRWGLDPRLVQAVMDAEGGPEALIRAVRLSVPAISTLVGALEVTCRSITHRLWEYAMHPERRAEFVAYLGSKWAPIGAENDPTNLNRNWVHNVLACYGRKGN